MARCEEALRLFAFLPGGPALIPCEGKRPVLPDWPRAIEDPPAWRAKLNGHAGNVGLVAGGGLVVFDVDVYADPAVEEAWEEFCLEHGLPITLGAATPSGGRHWFYRTAVDIGTGNLAQLDPRLARVDVRGRGGQVIVEPSVGPDGSPYLFLDGRVAEEGSEIVEALTASAEAAILSALHSTAAEDEPEIDGRARELTERAAELLRRHGATTRWVRGGYMAVTRPGRHEEATSGTLGHPQVGAGTLHVFSTAWPPFVAGRNYGLPELRDLLEPPTDEERRPTGLLVPSSSIRSVATRFLWTGHIVAEELNLLVGREKLGKSTGALWIAARLTTGSLPGDFEGRPLTVGYLSAEDSPARTLKPRAEAAGADHDRLLFISDAAPDFRIDDLAGLGLDVVVFDPMSGFIDLGGRDEHGEIGMRQAFKPLRRLADGGITVVAIRHERKGSTTDSPFDVVMGSRAWPAAFRSIVFFTPDREHPDRPGGLIFQRGNLTRPSAGMRYRLDPHPVDLDDGNVGETPLFALDPGAVSVTLEESVGPKERATARLDAEAFLRDALAGGPVPAEAVKRQAEEEGISPAALRRARESIGVTPRRAGPDPTSEWEWLLP